GHCRRRTRISGHDSCRGRFAFYRRRTLAHLRSSKGERYRFLVRISLSGNRLGIPSLIDQCDRARSIFGRRTTRSNPKRKGPWACLGRRRACERKEWTVVYKRRRAEHLYPATKSAVAACLLRLDRILNRLALPARRHYWHDARLIRPELNSCAR